MHKDLVSHIGRRVVLDTASNWTYIGRLDRVTDGCAVLSDADAHDISDSTTGKERYIHESRTTGIRMNRRMVNVVLAHVVSFSLFDDVLEY